MASNIDSNVYSHNAAVDKDSFYNITDDSSWTGIDPKDVFDLANTTVNLRGHNNNHPQNPNLYSKSAVLSVLVLAVLLVCLSIVLVALVIRTIQVRRQQRLDEVNHNLTGTGRSRGFFFSLSSSHRHQHEHDEDDQLAAKERQMQLQARVLRRYQTIEGWMISKRVIAHDEFCDQVHQNFVNIKKNKNVVSNNNNNKDHGQQPQLQQEQKNQQAQQDVVILTHANDDDDDSTSTTTQLAAKLDKPQSACCGCNSGNLTVGTASFDTDDEDDMHDQDFVGGNGSCCSATSSSSSSSGILDYMQDDDDDKECPICMEAFKVGDVVSWSANHNNSTGGCCKHVFHHACIKEWLLRHTHCPMCRQVMMPVDDLHNRSVANGDDADEDTADSNDAANSNDGSNNNNNNNNNNDDDAIDNHNATSSTRKSARSKKNKTKEALRGCSRQFLVRAASTYYCMREGLVEIPSVLSCTEEELEGLSRKICDCAVPRVQLASIRPPQEGDTKDHKDNDSGGNGNESSSRSDNNLMVRLGHPDGEGQPQQEIEASIITAAAVEATTEGTAIDDNNSNNDNIDEELGQALPENNEVSSFTSEIVEL